MGSRGDSDCTGRRLAVGACLYRLDARSIIDAPYDFRLSLLRTAGAPWAGLARQGTSPGPGRSARASSWQWDWGRWSAVVVEVAAEICEADDKEKNGGHDDGVDGGGDDEGDEEGDEAHGDV